MREGEESQEDTMNITSDENFPEAWICICISHVHDSWSSCDSELIKCLNSQTWQNGWTTKIMHGWWKFDQTLKNWTWLHVGCSGQTRVQSYSATTKPLRVTSPLSSRLRRSLKSHPRWCMGGVQTQVSYTHQDREWSTKTKLYTRNPKITYGICHTT